MKILVLIFTAFFLFFGSPVLAALEVPKNVPLQPLPEGVSPNYPNSIQSGDFVGGGTEHREDVPETEVDESDDDNAQEPIAAPLGQGTNSDNGFATMMAIMVVVLSIAFSGLYYWFKTRRTEKKS